MHILVVEDDYFAARAISDEIRALGDTVLGPVATARDAAACAADADAAILDVHLGSGTSFCVADAMRSQDRPFVFLTGRDMQTMPIRFRTDAVRAKPSTTRSLLVDLYRIRMCAGTQAGPYGAMVDMLAYARLRLEDHAAAERLVEAVMLKAIHVVEGDTVVPDLRALLIALLDAEIGQHWARHLN